MPKEPLENPKEGTSHEAPSRRSFLKGVGVAGVAATLSPLSAAETAMRENMLHPLDGVSGSSLKRIDAQTADVVQGKATTVAVELRVNGAVEKVRIDPRASLLDTLRENSNLTGTKKGCDHGQCGACTVHLDGKRILSCLTLALSAQGHEVTTIEGLGSPEMMHPMQASFVKHDSYQCGYCTSGQIMSAVALMKEPIGPDDADVKEAMSGNICRCGAYSNIIDAIQEVRKA